jgi:hypothetical protein
MIKATWLLEDYIVDWRIDVGFCRLLCQLYLSEKFLNFEEFKCSPMEDT